MSSFFFFFLFSSSCCCCCYWCFVLFDCLSFFHIFSFSYWLISLSFYFWPLASASARFFDSRISGKTNLWNCKLRMKSKFTKRCFFKNFLKVSTDFAILISRGKSFQSLGAAATKARSPRVLKFR